MTATNQKDWQIAIVGAGPAGLTAALAAHKLGFAVEVFEAAKDFQQIGGGILIHSNGQRVLAALGLLESFEPEMVLLKKAFITGWRQRTFAEINFSEANVPFNRCAVIWRYQLQEYLLQAARVAGIKVNFNCRVTDVGTNDNRAIVHFENNQTVESDVIIAADGVNSRVRDAALVEFQKVEIGEGWVRGASAVELTNTALREIWGDDGRRFGSAPLTNGKTYFYARVPLGEWNDIRQNRLDEWIASWRNFGEDVLKTLHGVEDWSKVNYSELSEIRAQSWAKPPIFLIGDAAHAMTPNVGQGANSAMVDALVLPRMLAKARENGESLTQVEREYTNLRRPFVTRIQNTARQSGALAAQTGFAAHIARNLLFAASRNIKPFRKQNLLVSVGYNKAETKFFAPL